MKNPLLVVTTLIALNGQAAAVDYIVDFTRMQDYEKLRPIIDQCRDYDAFELYRDKMHALKNLNDMRATFENSGYGLFNECPEGITGEGIATVK